MKVLLVYPKYPDTFWSFRHALAFTGKKAAFPPLGLLTIAAMLPKEWTLRLLDENIGEISDEDILWADLVFISAMLAQSKATVEMLARCRLFRRDTVAGGAMFTSDPDRFSGLVDHLVLGEAERSLPYFLEDLKQGHAKPVYASEAKVYCDIMISPIPRWDLLQGTMRSYSSVSLQFGKGCPHDCEFCNVTGLNGRIMRLKTATRVIEELSVMYYAGWRGSVFFADDNFIGHKKKAKGVLAEIAVFQQTYGYPFQFYTQVDISLADDDELISMMARAGFFRVFIGIETPEIESLKGANKHLNAGVDMPASVKHLFQRGIQVQGGYVLGFDQDTVETPRKMIDLIQTTGVLTAMVGPLQALPGTRLYHRLSAEGRLLGNSTGDNTDGTVNFTPKGMTREELAVGYRNVVSTIYSPEMYYGRLLTFLDEYRPNPLLRHHFSWGSMRAFVFSVVRIGILSQARSWYWRSFIETARRNPAAFSAVVEHWIFRFHFDRVSRNLIKPES